MTIAITGVVPAKTDKQAIPLTPLEPIEAAWAAYEQGAFLIDIHARHDDKTRIGNTTILELPALKLLIAA